MKAEAASLAAIAFGVFVLASICAFAAASVNDELKSRASRLATVTTYAVLIALFVLAFAVAVLALLLYIGVLQP